MKKLFVFGKSITICMALFICSLFSNDLFAQQENRDVSGFNSISYSLPGSLEIYQGTSESLIIKGEADDISMIITKVEGGELKIYTKNHSADRMGDIVVVVHVINLNELSVAGSGDVSFKTGLKTDDLEISLSGSGNLNCAELSANSAEINLAGSGDVQIGGTATEKVEINIAGSGDVDAEKLQSKEGEVNISGSGSVRVWVTNTLESNIVGSGSVCYKGNPQVETSVTGSGSTRSL